MSDTQRVTVTVDIRPGRPVSPAQKQAFKRLYQKLISGAKSQEDSNNKLEK